MPIKVVDASAMGALIFGEPEAETVAKQLSRSTLVAPQPLRGSIEAVNPCVNLGEAGRLYARYIRQASAIPVGGTAFRTTEQTPPEYLQLVSKARRAVTVGEASRVAGRVNKREIYVQEYDSTIEILEQPHRVAPADQVVEGSLQDHLLRAPGTANGAFRGPAPVDTGRAAYHNGLRECDEETAGLACRHRVRRVARRPEPR